MAIDHQENNLFFVGWKTKISKDEKIPNDQYPAELIVKMKPNGRFSHGKLQCVAAHSNALFNANGTIHKWSTQRSLDNVISVSEWNRLNGQWDHEWDIEQMMRPGHGPHELTISNQDIVFVCNQDMVLVIGAKTNKAAVPPVWRYRIGTKKWEHVMGDDRFCLRENGDTVLSSDQRYVIIVQGQDIHVLDIGDDREYKFWTSSIRSPFSSGAAYRRDQPRIARSGGTQLLTSGWVRRLCATTDILKLETIPIDVVDLAKQWVSTKLIHLMGNAIHGIFKDLQYKEAEERKHWVIPLVDILANLQLP